MAAHGAPLAGVALTADTAILTSIANAYSYKQVVVRQIDAGRVFRPAVPSRV